MCDWDPHIMLDMKDQLKKHKLSPTVTEQSDQGVHYTVTAYRKKVAGIRHNTVDVKTRMLL